MRHALERLKRNGHLPTTFITFAREGTYGQRHIMGKWRSVDTYAFRVSGLSTTQQATYQNTSDQKR